MAAAPFREMDVIRVSLGLRDSSKFQLAAWRKRVEESLQKQWWLMFETEMQKCKGKWICKKESLTIVSHVAEMSKDVLVEALRRTETKGLWKIWLF